MAELRAVAAQLRRLDNEHVTDEMRARLSVLARPLTPMVRASILNIPSSGAAHSGLRARIAGCVETWTWIDGPLVQVGVAVNAAKMPSGQKALPLYMEGAKAPWRHPVYGTGTWAEQAAHPYFWDAVAWYGPAARRTLDQMLDDISRRFSG